MKNTVINMAEELFLEQLHYSVDCVISEGARMEAQRRLAKAITVKEKLAGLARMLAIYFAEKDYLSAFFAVDKFLDDPAMTKYRAYLLFQKGRASECLYEFDNALIYYCRGLASHVIPRKIYFSLWHGVSLCLLHKQDFKQAEFCCRKVLELDQSQWEAWKNLGVSLEHQERFEEAVDAYGKAIKLSEKNEVAILHLLRLVKRRQASKN